MLLPRCHQMELTSGCSTVLCHCASAQSPLPAALRIPQGQEQVPHPVAGWAHGPLPPATATATGIPKGAGRASTPPKAVLIQHPMP